MSAASVRVRGATKLFDMRDGYPFARNVLGFSDPSVAWTGDRWTMFLGGMAPTSRTNVYSFELPPGAPVTGGPWRPSSSGVMSSRRVRPIIPQPPGGAWSRCIHAVCFVRGIADGEVVERIYHAGRSAESVLNPRLPHRIGYLERRPGKPSRSIRHPLALHASGRESVLEPKVEYLDGLWRMRFLTLPAAKPGSEDPGQFRIMHTTSRNGRDGWSRPEEWFGREDGFFDSVVVDGGDRALMVITRDSDLEGRPDNPPQGVWVSQAHTAGAPRADWSPPERIFAAEDAGYEWTARGTCAPSAVWADAEHTTLSVFFAGAPRDRTWHRLARQAVRRRRLPSFPSPVFFTIGRLDLAVAGRG